MTSTMTGPAATLPSKLSTISIQYRSEDFTVIANGDDELPTSWDDILWSAITVGRPSRGYVFRHGPASAFEALFRLSLVRMALEQRGYRGYRLRRTQAFRSLDPTEKGAASYFLGMTFCKLFASARLGTPWLLHLDVFKDQPSVNAVLSQRSRPDMIGKKIGSPERWYAFECKGRSSMPDSKAKERAKKQSERIDSVNGQPCAAHVATFTYLQSETLRFSWADPEQRRERSGINITVGKDAWRDYYEPAWQLFSLAQSEGRAVDFQDFDVEMAFHPEVAALLGEGRWSEARQFAEGSAEMLEASGYRPDGMAIEAGSSWRQTFEQG